MGAIVFGVPAVALIRVVRDTGRIKEDAAITGLCLSYHLDTASGAMIVLVQGTVFALVYLFGPRHGLIGSRITKRRQRTAHA